MSTITRLNSKVTVGAMDYGKVAIPGNIFDLQSHRGERIRVHIGDDNKLTVESRPTQKLLICELDVPETKYVHTKTTKKDDNGEYIIETKEKELDLSKVEMKEYLVKEEVKR